MPSIPRNSRKATGTLLSLPLEVRQNIIGHFLETFLHDIPFVRTGQGRFFVDHSTVDYTAGLFSNTRILPLTQINRGFSQDCVGPIENAMEWLTDQRSKARAIVKSISLPLAWPGFPTHFFGVT